MTSKNRPPKLVDANSSFVDELQKYAPSLSYFEAVDLLDLEDTPQNKRLFAKARLEALAKVNQTLYDHAVNGDVSAAKLVKEELESPLGLSNSADIRRHSFAAAPKRTKAALGLQAELLKIEAEEMQKQLFDALNRETFS